jgi:TPR repeat protein
VEEGARLGCHHCQGVLALCYWATGTHPRCVRDEARSLVLARESSGNGSRYGQWALGLLYQCGDIEEGAAHYDFRTAQALALYRLAAAQNFDDAQFSLGCMYDEGTGIAKDRAEALRLYQLAAAQGHPTALYSVGSCHKRGRGGVHQDEAEAIRWYRRAQAAGHPNAAPQLQMLLHTLRA